MGTYRIRSEAAAGRETWFTRILLILAVFAGLGFGDTVAGLQWTAPAGWKSEEWRPMRAATYMVARLGGDTDGAECVVYFFGAGQGGSVEANEQEKERYDFERSMGTYRIRSEAAAGR